MSQQNFKNRQVFEVKRNGFNQNSALKFITNIYWVVNAIYGSEPQPPGKLPNIMMIIFINL